MYNFSKLNSIYLHLAQDRLEKFDELEVDPGREIIGKATRVSRIQPTTYCPTCLRHYRLNLYISIYSARF